MSKFSSTLSSMPDSAVSSIINAAAIANWKDVIPMAGGEPNFKQIINPQSALSQFNAATLTKYSPFCGFGELIKLISEKLRRLNNIEAQCDEIIVVPGGAGALWTSVMAVAGSDTEVIVTDPCWEHYHAIIRMTGSQAVTWPMFGERINGDLDFDALVSRITPKTSALLINTPLNPCGYVFSEKDLRRLIGICEKYNIHLICDEEYEAFVYGDHHHISPRCFSKKVISLHAMSKSFAVTGARIGYVVASPKIVTLMRRAALYSYMYPSSPSQCLAISILREDYVSYFAWVRQHYENKMLKLCHLLSDINNIVIEKPPGGVYLFPKLPLLSGKNAAMTLIDKDHVLCVPGEVAGASCAGHVRFFFGLGDDQLQEAATRIRERLAKVQAKPF